MALVHTIYGKAAIKDLAANIKHTFPYGYQIKKQTISMIYKCMHNNGTLGRSVSSMAQMCRSHVANELWDKIGSIVVVTSRSCAAETTECRGQLPFRARLKSHQNSG